MVAPSENDLTHRSFPGQKSDFRGYDRYDRIKTSAGHFSVVCPKKPPPGKPWLWRSLFWAAIKKVSDADLKLVEEGYHVVLVQSSNCEPECSNHTWCPGCQSHQLVALIVALKCDELFFVSARDFRTSSWRSRR